MNAFAVPIALLVNALLWLPSCSRGEEVAITNAGFEQVPSSPLAIPGWFKIQHATSGEASFQMRVDDAVHAVGERSVRFERILDQPLIYGLVTQTIDASALAGRTIEFNARVRTEQVGPRGIVLSINYLRGDQSLDQARSTPVVGTQEWNSVKIQSLVPAGTTRIKLGVMLMDAGIAWADDLHLSASGKAVVPAAKPRVKGKSRPTH
ncbi:MAG: hypothetical protein ABI411_00010 [Tahibacter sp.]